MLSQGGTATPLNPLVPGLQDVTDLNDNGVIAGKRTTEQSQTAFFLYDVGADSLVTLPSLPQFHGPTRPVYGPRIDNKNRTIVGVGTNDPSFDCDVYWIGKNDTSWTYSGINNTTFPYLSKSGLILANLYEYPSSDEVSCIDLNLDYPDSGLNYVPGAAGSFQEIITMTPQDANWAGQIVGKTFADGRALIFSPGANASYKVDLGPGWTADEAVGINASGAIHTFDSLPQ